MTVQSRSIRLAEANLTRGCAAAARDGSHPRKALDVHRRSRLAPLAGLLALALFAAGCGGESSGDDGAEDGPDVRTIEHIYGTTEVTGTPKRVVTIGGNAGDLALALGVVPVGITTETEEFGADEDGLQPWFREELDEQGGEVPDAGMMNAEWELEYERIASVDPDIILATRGWVDEESYKRLDSIAPTVGPLVAQGNGGGWDEELRTIGEILDAEDAADRVIEDLEDQIAEARADHPRLDGATLLWSYAPENGQVRFLSGEYGGLNTFALFGITEDPSIAESSAKFDEERTFAEISLENLSQLETDIYFVVDMSLDSLNPPLVKRWAPAAEGRYIQYDDLLLDSAVYSPSPLALDWLIEDSGLLDQLEQALDGEAVVRRAATT